MAVVTGPLFSISATGTIGKAFTFGIWKGINYVRQWFTPSNPNTQLQQNVRKALSLVIPEYRAETPANKDAFDAGAQGQGLSGYNLCMKRALNQYNIQLGSDTDPLSVAISGAYPTDVYTWLPVV